MRTTLIIADSVARRAKALARRERTSLSRLVTESLADRMAREGCTVKEPPAVYRVKPVRMGIPLVDLNDREALYRRMEEDA